MCRHQDPLEPAATETRLPPTRSARTAAAEPPPPPNRQIRRRRHRTSASAEPPPPQPPRHRHRKEDRQTSAAPPPRPPSIERMKKSRMTQTNGGIPPPLRRACVRRAGGGIGACDSCCRSENEIRSRTAARRAASRARCRCRSPARWKNGIVSSRIWPVVASVMKPSAPLPVSMRRWPLAVFARLLRDDENDHAGVARRDRPACRSADLPLPADVETRLPRSAGRRDRAA